jgi:threonine dehydrogenase-like Zn-dependent dehydrogenase
MATGWHAAVSAGVTKGSTAVVVGDGAVGLCGVIAARELGAERIIAMSRHEPRQDLARRFGATDIVAERGKDGGARVKDLTDGIGADAVLECVGTDDSMQTAFAIARAGSMVGFVGVPHGVELPVRRMFQKNVGLAGGVAPVRRYLPELLELVTTGAIDPGLVFDLTLPLADVAEGYRAMDERRAIKVLLKP